MSVSLSGLAAAVFAWRPARRTPGKRRRACELHASARLDEVHQRNADDHGRGAEDTREPERPPCDARQIASTSELIDADDEG